MNAAAVLGRQFAGKKAEFAGDGLRTQTRVFGAVAADIVDLDSSRRDLKQEGDSRLRSRTRYTNRGWSLRQPGRGAGGGTGRSSQKMKDAGVTTIAVFADNAMVRGTDGRRRPHRTTSRSGSTPASSTATSRCSRGATRRTSRRHLFGMTWLWPWLEPDPDPVPPAKSIDHAHRRRELVLGREPGHGVAGCDRCRSSTGCSPVIHAAGPAAHAEDLPSRASSRLPASGGAATGNPLVPLIAYGRQTGLPYPSYMYGGTDFVAVLLDPDTTGVGVDDGHRGQGRGVVPAAGEALQGGHRHEEAPRLLRDRGRDRRASTPGRPVPRRRCTQATAPPARQRPAPRNPARRAPKASSPRPTARAASAGDTRSRREAAPRVHVVSIFWNGPGVRGEGEERAWLTTSCSSCGTGTWNSRCSTWTTTCTRTRTRSPSSCRPSTRGSSSTSRKTTGLASRSRTTSTVLSRTRRSTASRRPAASRAIPSSAGRSPVSTRSTTPSRATS